MTDLDLDPALGPRQKIGYVAGTFPSLTETFVLREVGALRRRGLELVVFALRRPHGAQDALKALGADATCIYARPDSLLRHTLANLTYLLRRPRRYFTGLGIFLKQAAALPLREGMQLLYHFIAGVGVCRDARRRGVDHLHCHFSSATSLGLAASLIDDMPFSFTAHASDDLFVRPVLLDQKVARASFVVPESDYAGHYLDSITGFRFSHKLNRIYNGVELGEAERLSAGVPNSSSQPDQDNKCLVIVSVGQLVARKGHATLIQLCARLRANGRSFQCRIIGEGPERLTLERLIAREHLRDCVQLVGPLGLDRVYAELRKADVFALLAEIGPNGNRDGFPTVILEAMAAGLPVLSTILVGIPEMVEDGVTGLLVPERKVDAAFAAMERLLDSAQLRHTLGQAGKSRVRRLFNLDHSADTLAVLLTNGGAAPGKSGQGTQPASTEPRTGSEPSAPPYERGSFFSSDHSVGRQPRSSSSVRTPLP